jgi:hypothetical protein
MRILVRMFSDTYLHCRASESRVQFASGAYLIVDTIQFVILYLREQFVLVGSVPYSIGLVFIIKYRYNCFPDDFKYIVARSFVDVPNTC